MQNHKLDDTERQIQFTPPKNKVINVFHLLHTPAVDGDKYFAVITLGATFRLACNDIY